MATTLHATLLGETTAQQKTPPATLTIRPATESRSARNLTRHKDANKKQSQSQHETRGMKRTDKVGVSKRNPAFEEVMIHA